MKNFRFVSLLLSFLIALNISFAQTPKNLQTKPPSKPVPAKVEEKKRPNADGRTKTGDKVNHSLKGPKGETVYTGPKGGNYYLSKSGEKIYLGKDGK